MGIRGLYYYYDLLTNSKEAFKWKLSCHWLISLWAIITLYHPRTGIFVTYESFKCLNGDALLARTARGVVLEIFYSTDCLFQILNYGSVTIFWHGFHICLIDYSYSFTRYWFGFRYRALLNLEDVVKCEYHRYLLRRMKIECFSNDLMGYLTVVSKSFKTIKNKVSFLKILWELFRYGSSILK